MTRVVIVDDDFKCHALLKDKLDKFDQFKVVASAFNVEDAVKAISKEKPNLVFLDIELAGESGFDVLGFFKEFEFDTVCITGHPEYALKAIKYSVFDYLLKPIQDKELDSTLLKFFSNKKKTIPISNTDFNEQLSVATPNGFELIDISNVVRIRASGSYSTIFLSSEKKIVTTRSLKFFEERLNNYTFIRINRQDLVNFGQVKRLFKGRYPILELKNGEQLQVSDRKRKLVRDLFFS